MADDPREVLKAAGVECVEVDELWNDLAPYWCPNCHEEHEREYSELNRRIAGDAVDAVLALARLAVEFKHQLDDRTERVKQAIDRSRVTAVSPQEVLDLIDRVARTQDDEKRDAYLVAKYKWERDEAINLTADSEDEAMDLLEDVEQGWRVACDAKPSPC